MKLSKVIFGFALVGISIVSCTQQQSVTLKSKTSIQNTEWNLLHDNEVVKGLYDKNVTLSFDNLNNSIAGFAGCNTYSAEIESTGEVMKFINVTSAEMLCPHSATEQAFMDVLDDVDRYQVQGKELYLYKGNILLLKFSKQ